MRKNLALLTVLGLASLVAFATIGSLAGEAEPADVPDPGTIALPEFDDAATDPAKAIAIDVAFASRTSATVTDVTVSIQRAHSHIGDPPILRLSLKDPDGSVLDQMNAWSPLWNFFTGSDAREHMSIKPSGNGSFIVPFSPDLATVTVRDIGLNQDVLTANVGTAISEFCTANPTDPDCLEADLGVDSIAPSGPLFGVVGETATVSVPSVVSNAGPDGPVDALVTRSATASAGLTVTPTGPETTDVAALAVGETRELTRGYTVACTGAGSNTVSFTTAIAPKLPAVTDPVATNNTRTVSYSVDCAVPVTINILPGSTTNPVNRNGSTLPVAVLTTTAGEYGNPLAFDATTIDPLSARFASRARLLAGAGVPEKHLRGHLENTLELDERTRDSDLDMMLHFAPRTDSLALSDTRGCVLGRFNEPTGPRSFFGCDAVRVIK